MRDAVRTGRLQPGTRLPSSRALAADLGLARNTVADAYGQLVAEGWLVARQGSGTRVAERADTADAASPRAVAQALRYRYDLRPGSPDLSSFPRAAWLAAARQAVNQAPSDAFGYGDPAGRLELRAALAGYLSRARGVRATAERIVVCSGFTQGLGLLCQVLRTRGAVSLATEAVCLPANRDIITANGLRQQPLPVDADGAVTDELTDTSAVLLTPAHQFPLGAVLTAARRHRVVQWAIATGGVVIEDDYDGEFRYDRRPVGALQALAPEQVVYAGTASKALAPGLRLSWLVLPADLAGDVTAAKALADRHSSNLDQLALAAFIASGGYDRHLRGRRIAYRHRRDRLVAAITNQVPGVRTRGVSAGLHALVELPEGQSESEVVARAGRRGLAIQGLGAYSQAGHPQHPAIVVGYGTPPDHAYGEAIARLCAAIRPRPRAL